MALKTEKINEQPFQVVNTDTKSSINKENREDEKAYISYCFK